jgi:hypothetical protein
VRACTILVRRTGIDDSVEEEIRKTRYILLAARELTHRPCNRHPAAKRRSVKEHGPYKALLVLLCRRSIDDFGSLTTEDEIVWNARWSIFRRTVGRVKYRHGTSQECMHRDRLV